MSLFQSFWSRVLSLDRLWGWIIVFAGFALWGGIVEVPLLATLVPLVTYPKVLFCFLVFFHGKHTFLLYLFEVLLPEPPCIFPRGVLVAHSVCAVFFYFFLFFIYSLESSSWYRNILLFSFFSDELFFYFSS